MTDSEYPIPDKCDNPSCPDCYPEEWDPEEEPRTRPAWAWPWTLLLILVLIVWAVWFVSTGAATP